MNQATCVLVVVATKSLQARRKALTDTNKNTCTLAAKTETQKRSVELKYISVQRQRNKMIILRVGGSCFEYYFVRQVCDTTYLHINLKKGIRFFTKSNDVSLTYRRSVYVAMGLWKVPQQGHFIFVIFINFTFGFVPITSVRWPSCGKFVLGLPDILFVANNTSRHINTMVCACQFLVEWEGFIFAQYLWNTWHHWFVVFHSYHKVYSGHKDPTCLWHALSSCLKQGACS